MLIRLNLLLFALLVVHTLDHALNQPARELPATGSLAALAGFAIVAAAAVLALRRSPSAPAAAVFSGLVTALGLVAIHLTPRWLDAVSDPLWEFGADPLTWALTLAPLVAALALASFGARELQSRAAAAA
jgi:LPXTG-motif cell wall-anchored protein